MIYYQNAFYIMMKNVCVDHKNVFKSMVTFLFLVRTVSFKLCVCGRPYISPQLEFIRKRYHKDLLLNPVLMLNFCPDLLSEPTELQQASRELIFLIDNSSTITQHSINKIKVLHDLLLSNTILKPDQIQLHKVFLF